MLKLCCRKLNFFAMVTNDLLFFYMLTRTGSDSGAGNYLRTGSDSKNCAVSPFLGPSHDNLIIVVSIPSSSG